MTHSSLVLSVSETALILMRSTGKYVYRRITTKQGKDAYRLSMVECIKVVSSGLENLDMIKTKVQSHLSETEHLYPKTLFNKRHEEIRYHEMAVYQTMDILESLEARFITGSCDSEPRGYRGKAIDIYEDESIFG